MADIVLRDYQDKAVVEVRDSFRAGYKALLLVLSTGGGKCLAKNTPVLMFDGSIKMVQDVVVGDALIGPDSKPRIVLSLAYGKEEMYKVTPRKGDPYVVNKSHILSLRMTGDISRQDRRVYGGDGILYSAGDVVNISVSDYLKSTNTFKHMAKGWRASIDFKKQNKLPIPAYILGAWLGDGSTGKLNFTTGDTEIYNEIAKYAKSVGMKCNVSQNSDYSVVVQLVSNGVKFGRGGSPFGNALRTLGIFSNKSIPLIYKTASRRDRLELLAGFIDTDGHYTHKGFAITQKSEALLDGIIFIARSLGFAAYKSSIKKTCHNNGVVGDYFSCCISGDGIENIPCRLPRKKAAPRKQKKNVLNVGVVIEPVGVGDYYGFEISGTDRLFLLGDFTVTHNTVIFSHIARSATDKGRKVLILAHRDQLIKQASRKLRDSNVRHGIIMAGFTPDLTSKAQVASVQTLVRRLDKIRFVPDLIIIDEAHLSAAKTYLKILEHYSSALVLGVTGTPCRLDGKPLGRDSGGIYDHMVLGVAMKTLISNGFLVPPVVYGASEVLDLSSVKMLAGDYNEAELAAVVDTPKIIGSAVAHYLSICPDAPAVAWCVNLAHAEHVANEFNANGIKTVMLSGNDSGDVRDKALAALDSGEVKIITFVGILVEGVDCPAIEAIILLRPTMSLSAYLQVVGRGLRPNVRKGVKKQKCFVLDHASLWCKHGLPDEERDWVLNVDPESKKKRSRKPQEVVDVLQCKFCYGCFAPAPVCPFCGKPVVKAGGDLTAADGILSEITPEMAAMARNTKKHEVSSARSLADLERIAAERGHSRGWAQHVFNARLKKETKRPPSPPLELLKKMSLSELKDVAYQQNWPATWPSEFIKSQQNLGE